ncbi:MAG: hypothetical protein NVS1B11_34230 [Terriglobales bacterium]
MRVWQFFDLEAFRFAISVINHISKGTCKFGNLISSALFFVELRKKPERCNRSDLFDSTQLATNVAFCVPPFVLVQDELEQPISAADVQTQRPGDRY